MRELMDHGIHTYKIEGSYLKTRIQRLVWIFCNWIWEDHGGIG